MTQLQYGNTRALLVREMTKLENKFSQASSDLVKFKDMNITVHNHDALLMILAIHLDILTREITLCNDRLRQLHSTIGQVISEKRIGQ